MMATENAAQEAAQQSEASEFKFDPTLGTAEASETATETGEGKTAAPTEEGQTAPAKTSEKDAGTQGEAAQLQSLLADHAKSLSEIRQLKQQLEGSVSVKDLQEYAAENPVEFLEKLGINRDDPRLLAGYLPDDKAGDAGSAGQQDPELAKQIAALQEGQKKLDLFLAQQKASEADQQYDQAVKQVTGWIDESADFPLVKESKSHGRVIKVMEDFWEKSGEKETLPWEKAAAQVEAEIKEEFVSRSKLPAFMALSGGSKSKPPAGSAITNDMSADAPAISEDDEALMADPEGRRKLYAQFLG